MSSTAGSSTQVDDNVTTTIGDAKTESDKDYQNMGDSEEESSLSIVIKHGKDEFKIENLMPDHTIGFLKSQLQELTNVQPHRQKLFGIKSVNSQLINDDLQLEFTNIIDGMKIMMMGSQETDIKNVEAASANVQSKVEDDFEITDDDASDLDALIPNNPEYNKKILRRVVSYKIDMINLPRPGKKLLVLDIDYTLFDHKSVGQSGQELMRPYLHEFLTLAYRHYDIVIWSATSMRFITAKMQELRVASNPNYKITFYLDSKAMIQVYSHKYNYLINVKPLAVIWGKFPHYYTPKNTIMFDDVRRNFTMNPQNGLKIKAYRDAHMNRSTDKELVYLSRYLEIISTLDDFSQLDHDKWKNYYNQYRESTKKQKLSE